MPTAKIVTEVQTFVARVREGLGVAPVIYTSSFFWDTVFNESTAYSADPLWITEYGVSTPTVPADNWGGDGWTLWQTSATGIVPASPPPSTSTSSTALTLTIDDPTIQPGDTIYLETASGLIAVNAVVTAGVAVVTFSTDPMFVVVAPRPAITSANSANAATGQAFHFTATATGSPVPMITASGNPSWLTLTDNHNGTAALAASHPVAGVYQFTITSTNGVVPNALQSFTLTVRKPQAVRFVSPAVGTCSIARKCTVLIATVGWPPPTLSESGALPKGMTFVASKNGTATLSGTPARGALGLYLNTLTASNGEGLPVTQHLRLLIL